MSFISKRDSNGGKGPTSRVTALGLVVVVLLQVGNVFGAFDKLPWVEKKTQEQINATVKQEFSDLASKVEMARADAWKSRNDFEVFKTKVEIDLAYIRLAVDRMEADQREERRRKGN